MGPRDSARWSSVSAVGTIFLALWPHYFYGHQINGIIDRSLLMAILLIAIGLPGMCNALFWVLGGTPTAWDTSRYPLLLFPIGVVLFMYGALLYRLVVDGAPDLSWHIVSTAYNVNLQSSTFDATAGHAQPRAGHAAADVHDDDRSRCPSASPSGLLHERVQRAGTSR